MLPSKAPAETSSDIIDLRPPSWRGCEAGGIVMAIIYAIDLKWPLTCTPQVTQVEDQR